MAFLLFRSQVLAYLSTQLHVNTSVEQKEKYIDCATAFARLQALQDNLASVIPHTVIMAFSTYGYRPQDMLMYICYCS